MLYLKIASEASLQRTRATHWLEWVPVACSSSYSPELDISQYLLENSMQFLSEISTLCFHDPSIIVPLSEIIYSWVFKRSHHLQFIRRSEKLLTCHPHLLEHYIAFVQDTSSICRISVQSDAIFILATTKSGNEIWSISKTNVSLNLIYDTTQLRALVLSEVLDPWKWLWELGIDWVAYVMDLLQQELNDTRQLSQIITRHQIIDYRTEENYTSQYRQKCLKALCLLVKTFGVLPHTFYLKEATKEGTHAVFGGGFADIWRGRFDNTVVCLKVLRSFTSANASANQQLRKEFCREALVWKQLDHPNVLPFKGVNEDLFSPSYCLISPWMKHGNVMEFLQRHPDQGRLSLIAQVADGLQYLHGLDPPVIHGDIRGANILITDDCRCCLADFGLALMAESHSYKEKSLSFRGSIRWMAPEILDPTLYHPSRPRTSRDIYAFGCTVVEILTGNPPFPDIRYDVAVISRVLRGYKPQIPASLTSISPDLAELIYRCWDPVPSERPTAEDISSCLVFYTSSNA
ncbi:kinase-like domain-containing protein [Lentinula raphanica]|nr:kinase-like domain-containing protein [Lentinula raphanica]